jgi:hypothetical protein
MPHQLVLGFTTTIPKALHVKLPTSSTNHQSYSSPDKAYRNTIFVPRIMELTAGQQETVGSFKGGIVSKGDQGLDDGTAP